MEEGDVVDGTGQGMAGELVAYIVAFPGIAGEGLCHGGLRFSSQIGIGRIKIVDALPDCKVEHGIHLCLVDLSGGGVRCKAHAAKSQKGQPAAVKLSVDHISSSPFLSLPFYDSVYRLKGPSAFLPG